MKSLDTNVLRYALNADCAEHINAGKPTDFALQQPHTWIVADQVYIRTLPPAP